MKRRRREMVKIRNLKLSLGRFKVSCSDRVSLGIRLLKCFMILTHEDIVTDRLLVSKEAVKVLDVRK